MVLREDGVKHLQICILTVLTLIILCRTVELTLQSCGLTGLKLFTTIELHLHRAAGLRGRLRWNMVGEMVCAAWVLKSKESKLCTSVEQVWSTSPTYLQTQNFTKHELIGWSWLVPSINLATFFARSSSLVCRFKVLREPHLTQPSQGTSRHTASHRCFCTTARIPRKTWWKVHNAWPTNLLLLCWTSSS